MQRRRHRGGARLTGSGIAAALHRRSVDAQRSRLSVSQPAVALLVLLAGAARARIVAADLLRRAHERRRARAGRRSPSSPSPLPLGQRLVVVGVLVLHVARRAAPVVDRLHVFLRAHLHGQSRRLTTSCLTGRACRRRARTPRACIPASGSSARSRAGGCPGAGSRARRGARASACRASAASRCARTGVNCSAPTCATFAVVGVVGAPRRRARATSSSVIELGSASSHCADRQRRAASSLAQRRSRGPACPTAPRRVSGGT